MPFFGWTADHADDVEISPPAPLFNHVLFAASYVQHIFLLHTAIRFKIGLFHPAVGPPFDQGYMSPNSWTADHADDVEISLPLLDGVEEVLTAMCGMFFNA